MNNWLRSVVLMTLYFTIYFSAYSQSLEKKHMDYGLTHYCKGGGDGEKMFIPPPKQFLKNKKRGNSNINITVRYENFPDDVKPAFEYAIEIWKSVLSSPVEIIIHAEWEKINEEGLLGSCSPYSYYENFDRAPLKNVKYPVALADRLCQKSINLPNVADMYIYFNSDKSIWYLGTDGNTPFGKYDLVTVTLHEIAHGLGFTGHATANNQTSTAAWSEPLPSAFDLNIINSNKESIRDTSFFANNSFALYKQFINEHLYFGGHIVKQFNNNLLPKLFAPYQYENGSSIYHLNEDSYPYNHSEALMTPRIRSGQAIHNPGNIVKGIFYEMGWNYTNIIHDTINDSEDVNKNFEIKAEIKSDNTYDSSSVKLIYSSDNFSTKSTVDMQNESADLYAATISAPKNQATIGYYIEVSDQYRTYHYPGYPPDDIYTFRVGADREPPVLLHSPKEYLLSSTKNLFLEVKAIDNIGIDRIWVEYKLNNHGELFYANLYHSHDNLYSGNIPLQMLSLVEQDTFMYKILAHDLAQNTNSAILPSAYSFYELSIMEVRDDYTSNFDNLINDFTGEDFKIIKNNNDFNSPFLYCSYTNSGEDNFNDYSAQLKYPIRIKSENAYIQFDEIALIEPGKTESTYGEDDFFDYVVVEGSKDNGQNWYPFKAGYDARLHKEWLDLYNQGISAATGISSSKGTKNIWKLNTFNLHGQNNEFTVGDEIFIRFRLLSDPYSYGWGWAIDNLKIQKDIVLNTSNKQEVFQNLEFSIFPNPAREQIDIRFFAAQCNMKIGIQIVDITGKILYSSNDISGNFIFRKTIDTGFLNRGFYFIKINDGIRQGAKKIMIIP